MKIRHLFSDALRAPIFPGDAGTVPGHEIRGRFGSVVRNHNDPHASFRQIGRRPIQLDAPLPVKANYAQHDPRSPAIRSFQHQLACPVQC